MSSPRGTNREYLIEITVAAAASLVYSLHVRVRNSNDKQIGAAQKRGELTSSVSVTADLSVCLSLPSLSFVVSQRARSFVN